MIHRPDDPDPARMRLVGELIVRWAALERRAPSGDRLQWLSLKTGVSFHALDFARRVRNDIAHQTAMVATDHLQNAVVIVNDALAAIHIDSPNWR